MFYVSKKVGGEYGLFTSTKINRGDIFMDLLEGVTTRVRTRTSIQVDEDLHVEHEAARYINHSFVPNATVLDCALIAILEIEAGDEIVFDYTMNEDDISSPFIDKTTELLVGFMGVNGIDSCD